MIYKGITSFRNFLFDKNILKQVQPHVFSIGVGNLRVGGTGKTPMVAHLISLLKGKNIGVISRGYGRKTKGFYKIKPDSTASEVGDEPLMLAQNFPEVSFYVSENRVEGYLKALEDNPQINCLIFDDVFQHRYIKPHLNLLLTQYDRPFYEDWVLPWGRLRESRAGAMRADMVMVTKVPEVLNISEKEYIEDRVRKYSKRVIPVFFSQYLSSSPRNMKGEILEKGKEVVLVSGLANNQPFFENQAKNFHIFDKFGFKDHHKYSENDIESIRKKYPETPIITTEKDKVKIMPLLKKSDQLNLYWPEISVQTDPDFRNYLHKQMDID